MCIYVPTKGRKINFKMLTKYVCFRSGNGLEAEELGRKTFYSILYSYFYNGNVFMCYYVINKIKAKKKH